jgi:hypothetical protein
MAVTIDGVYFFQKTGVKKYSSAEFDAEVTRACLGARMLF